MLGKGLFVCCLLMAATFPRLSILATDCPPYQYADRKGDAEFIYDSISARSMPERRQVFAGLSAQMKRDLFAVHFERFLLQHPDLTEDQKQVVCDASAALSSQSLYSASSSEQLRDGVDGREHANLRRLAESAKAVLGPEGARALLAELGAPVPNPPSRVCARKMVGASVGAPSVNDDLPTCECNTWDDWCYGNSQCVSGGCYWRSYGCGTMFTYSCVGMCVLQGPG